MFDMFLGSVWNSTYVEGDVTINVSSIGEAKSLMMGYPLSFLCKGVHSNKQTSKVTCLKRMFQIACIRH